MDYETLTGRFHTMIGDHPQQRYIVAGVSVCIVALIVALIYYFTFSKPTPRLTPEGNHEERVFSGTNTSASQKLQAATEQLMDERRAAIQSRTEVLDKKITQEVKQSPQTSVIDPRPLMQQHLQDPTAGILPPDPFQLDPR